MVAFASLIGAAAIYAGVASAGPMMASSRYESHRPLDLCSQNRLIIELILALIGVLPLLLLLTVMVAAIITTTPVITCPPQLHRQWQRLWLHHILLHLHTPHPQAPPAYTALAPRIGTTTVVITIVSNVSALFACLVVVLTLLNVRMCRPVWISLFDEHAPLVDFSPCG